MGSAKLNFWPCNEECVYLRSEANDERPLNACKSGNTCNSGTWKEEVEEEAVQEEKENVGEDEKKDDRQEQRKREEEEEKGED